MLKLFSEEMRSLCIKNNWFTCGTNEQYTKLFDALKAERPIDEITTIIWLCSEDCWERDEIRAILLPYKTEHVERTGIPETYAEIEYPDMDSADAIDGARWDDRNYRHYMER